MTELLARPIEITSANYRFQINTNGAGTSNVDLDLGVYASIFTLLYELETKLQASPSGANFSVRLTTDFKIKIAHSSLTFLLTWGLPPLGRLLGYRAAASGVVSTHTATDTPENVWLPSFWSSDGSQFAADQKTVSASLNVVGQTSAVSLTGDTFGRSATWEVQTASNVYKSAWDSSYSWGSTFYPEQDRCLETLSLLARSVTLASEDSNNINPKGVYFINDVTDWQGDAPTNALPSSMDSGGINSDYIFCSIATDGMGNPSRSVDKSKDYYSVSIDLTSATAPTWLV